MHVSIFLEVLGSNLFCSFRQNFDSCLRWSRVINYQCYTPAYYIVPDHCILISVYDDGTGTRADPQ